MTALAAPAKRFSCTRSPLGVPRVFTWLILPIAQGRGDQGLGVQGRKSEAQEVRNLPRVTAGQRN